MNGNTCGRAAFYLAIVGVLAGCAGSPASNTGDSRRAAMMERCSERVIVYIRQGTSIRSDFELVEVGRRLGFTLEVLQTMGRNSKMVMIRGNGPQEVCDSAVEQLKEDPRIESIQ